MRKYNFGKTDKSGRYYRMRIEGPAETQVFRDEDDYQHFLSLMGKNFTDNDSVEAVAYCMAPDHFCLLLHENDKGSAEGVVSKLIAEYNKYYFDKYQVSDLLSDHNYKERRVEPCDLLATSCLIHTQTKDWADCEYSSIRAYFYDDTPVWLNKSYISENYGSAVQYAKMLGV